MKRGLQRVDEVISGCHEHCFPNPNQCTPPVRSERGSQNNLSSLHLARPGLFQDSHRPTSARGHAYCRAKGKAKEEDKKQFWNKAMLYRDDYQCKMNNELLTYCFKSHHNICHFCCCFSLLMLWLLMLWLLMLILLLFGCFFCIFVLIIVGAGDLTLL